MPNPDSTVTASVLPSDAQAIDAHLAAQLPSWLKGASLDQSELLRSSLQLHTTLQRQIAQLLQGIQPLDSFATPLLAQALHGAGAAVEVPRATWREVKVRINAGLFPVFKDSEPTLEYYNEDSPLLARALQNFTQAQTAADQHFPCSGIQVAGQAAPITPQRVAELCRTLDLGGRYQRHLDNVFQGTTAAQAPLQLLAAEKCNSIAVQAQLSLLKGEIDKATFTMLLQVSAGQGSVTHGGHLVRSCGLQLLEQRVQDALVFEVFEAFVRQYRVRKLIVYLPGDPLQPVREYPSWAALATALGQALAAPAYLNHFLRRFARDQCPMLAVALLPLQRQVQVELKLAPALFDGDPSVELARRQIAWIKADAAALAVPTAAVDQAVYRQRMQAYADAGMTLVGVVASFLPGVGEIMLASMVLQMLHEVYEGVEDWAHGRREEALGHLLGVAQNLAVSAVLAGGGAAVARRLRRSAFVDSLVPVPCADGVARLWDADLQPYRLTEGPAQRSAAANGLVRDNGRLYLNHQGHWYEVEQQAGHWQLRHPQRAQAYAPPLEHNGEGAWRLPGEQPLHWQGVPLLMRRLGPLTAGLSELECSQAGLIAGVGEAELRGLLVENRRLPASLRDVLEQWQLDRRLSRFFGQLSSPVDERALDAELFAHARGWLAQGTGGAASQLELRQQLPALRGELFDYVLSRQRPAVDAQQALLHRDFPGLPGGYARELLEQADAAQLQRMQREQRIPLAVAERARRQLREARLTRALLGLTLRNGGHADSARLALTLLRRLPAWPAGLNLELREGAWFGRLIERQQAVSDPREIRVLVASNGHYEVFSHDGYPQDVQGEPVGFFAAVRACLTPAQQVALGWQGDAGVQRMQQAVFELAVGQRERCAPLLGMSPPRPLLQRWHRLPDGRRGYPLSGRGANQRALMHSMVRTLFPGLGDWQIDRLLTELEQAEDGMMAGLVRLQRQWHTLDATLGRWVSGGGLSRQRFASALRLCWRRQGDRSFDLNGVQVGYSLRFNNGLLGELPSLPQIVSFEHVADLNLAGTGVSLQAEGFLRSFPQLRSLDLSSNELADIPEAVSGMNSLVDLFLDHNSIRISPAGAQRLAALSRLQILDLTGNPLGPGLDLAPLRNLRGVFLRNTQQATLPAGLMGNPGLQVIDLRQNSIMELPEAFFTQPVAANTTIVFDDNPLSPATLRRVRGLHEQNAERLPHTAPEQGMQLLLEGAQEPLRSSRARLWEQLRNEPGSADFLQLFADLSDTAAFAHAREDLLARAWRILAAATENSALRGELFDLTAHPTTCVDSVISTFSHLEVRFLLYDTLARASGEAAQPVLLRFARQLFRLDRLEQLARADINRRLALGVEADEVEVSLAYRVGLARELNLPGQPTHMQFQAIADVSPQQLQDAAQQVRQAEGSDALARFVSDRDFWRGHLRELHTERFEQVQAPFWTRLEQLEQQQASLAEGDYLNQMNTLGRQRETALDALVLRLTEEALNTPA